MREGTEDGERIVDGERTADGGGTADGEGAAGGEGTADGEETVDGEGDNGRRCITAFRNIKYTITLTYDIIGAIS